MIKHPLSDHLRDSFSDYPRQTVDRLVSFGASGNFSGVITAADVQTLLQETGLTLPQLMLDLTVFASYYAVTPISHYNVGAIACGLSGNLYYGANMEFAGQPLSLCIHAEQSATINAWMNGEQGMSSLAVNAAPCGYCRQYLYETTTASTLSIILSNESVALTSLLPDAFGPQDLGVQASLLSPYAHGLALVQPSNDPGVLAALAAANASYAPYTSSYAGVGIVTESGAVYSAPLSENAAYNPSLSPLEAALSQMNLGGQPYSSIVEVAIVQVAGAEVDQVSVTQNVLGSVTSVPLTVAYAAPQAAPSNKRLSGGYPRPTSRIRRAAV